MRISTPQVLVDKVRESTADWKYDVISIGYPGAVDARGPRAEPGNLGSGWVRFDFAKAFDKPVRVLNDAAMQALGGYDGGRMLFIGLGTGVGSALVTEHVVVPLELGCLPYCPSETIFDRLGAAGLESYGEASWLASVTQATTMLRDAFSADYVLIGGGNASRVQPLPPGARSGGNEDAFTGGFRLWEETRRAARSQLVVGVAGGALMRFRALATDYDGTLAFDGKVDEATIAALVEARTHGVRLVMVTGRELSDLFNTFDRCDLFERIVAENGAVLYDPATKAIETIAPPPPRELVDALEARSIPLSIGHSIVATVQPHEHEVLAAIRDLGLEWHVIFNKGAVMALPSDVTKASGLVPALAALGVPAERNRGRRRRRERSGVPAHVRPRRRGRQRASVGQGHRGRRHRRRARRRSRRAAGPHAQRRARPGHPAARPLAPRIDSVSIDGRRSRLRERERSVIRG